MTDDLIKFGGVIIASILATVVGLLLYFLKKKDDEINLIKNKISDEKYKTYFDIISLFFDLLKQDKGLTTFDKNDLAIRYIDIKKNLLLLGSDQVLLKYLDFDKNLTTDPANKDAHKIKKYLELFLLIRKDSGNPKTKLTIYDIIKSISATENDYYDIKKLFEKDYEKKGKRKTS